MTVPTSTTSSPTPTPVAKAVTAMVTTVVVILVVGFIGRGLAGGTASMPSDILTRPWVEGDMSLRDHGFLLQLPQPFDAAGGAPFPPALAHKVRDFRSRAFVGKGMTVSATLLVASPKVELDLNGAVEGALTDAANQAITRELVREEKVDVVLAGERAVEFKALVKQKQGADLRLRSILSLRGRDLWQLMLLTRADDRNAEAVWARMRDSVHPVK